MLLFLKHNIFNRFNVIKSYSDAHNWQRTPRKIIDRMVLPSGATLRTLCLIEHFSIVTSDICQWIYFSKSQPVYRHSRKCFTHVLMSEKINIRPFIYLGVVVGFPLIFKIGTSKLSTSPKVPRLPEELVVPIASLAAVMTFVQFIHKSSELGSKEFHTYYHISFLILVPSAAFWVEFLSSIVLFNTYSSCWCLLIHHFINPNENVSILQYWAVFKVTNVFDKHSGVFE